MLRFLGHRRQYLWLYIVFKSMSLEQTAYLSPSRQHVWRGAFDFGPPGSLLDLTDILRQTLSMEKAAVARSDRDAARNAELGQTNVE